MLVDDTELNLEIVKHVLERQNYKVDTAKDGIEAVAMAENNSYDIILMDCIMPNLDGFDATVQIRTSSTGNNVSTPIIAVTGRDDEESIQKAYDKGMQDFIAKPVDQKLLLEKLRRWAD